MFLSILAGVSAASSLVGSVLQAGEARRVGLLNAQLSESEARMQQLASATATQQGMWQAGQIRSQAAQMIGTQNVMVGGSGLAASSSSAQAMRSTTEVTAGADADMAIYNTILQAQGYDIQAASHRLQAAQHRRQAALAPIGHMLSGIGSAVGTGAQFFAGA